MLNELVDELARVVYDPEEATVLARRAGFPSGHLPKFSTPTVFWSRVIVAAEHGKVEGGMKTLANRAAKDYPYNPVFVKHAHGAEFALQARWPYMLADTDPGGTSRTKPLHAHPVDLWTPGFSRGTVMTSYTPIVGARNAEILWKASQDAILATTEGDFETMVTTAQRVACFAPASRYLAGESAYLEAEGYRLLADIADPSQRAGLRANARERYELASEYLPDDPRPLRGLGRALEVEGSHGEALEKFLCAGDHVVAGLARQEAIHRPDLAHEALRTSRLIVHCLIDIRRTSRLSAWSRESKRHELEGFLIACENLHGEYMPLFRSARRWSRIEKFMALVFLARAWGQIGSSDRAKSHLVHSLHERRRMITHEGRLSKRERWNLDWWGSVANECMAGFDRRSREAVESIALAVEGGDRRNVQRSIQEFLKPFLPPWYCELG